MVSDEMEEFYDVLTSEDTVELKELTPRQRLEALHPANHKFPTPTEIRWYHAAWTLLAHRTHTKGWNTNDLEFLRNLEDYVDQGYVD